MKTWLNLAESILNSLTIIVQYRNRLRIFRLDSNTIVLDYRFNDPCEFQTIPVSIESAYENTYSTSYGLEARIRGSVELRRSDWRVVAITNYIHSGYNRGSAHTLIFQRGVFYQDLDLLFVVTVTGS